MSWGMGSANSMGADSYGTSWSSNTDSFGTGPTAGMSTSFSSGNGSFGFDGISGPSSGPGGTAGGGFTTSYGTDTNYGSNDSFGNFSDFGAGPIGYGSGASFNDVYGSDIGIADYGSGGDSFGSFGGGTAFTDSVFDNALSGLSTSTAAPAPAPAPAVPMVAPTAFGADPNLGLGYDLLSSVNPTQPAPAQAPAQPVPTAPLTAPLDYSLPLPQIDPAVMASVLAAARTPDVDRQQELDQITFGPVMPVEFSPVAPAPSMLDPTPALAQGALTTGIAGLPARNVETMPVGPMSVPEASPASLPAQEEEFYAPVRNMGASPRIVSDFGWRNLPGRGRDFHEGIDIARTRGERGTAIFAAQPGRVESIRPHGNNSLGRIDVRNPNGALTTYYHIQALPDIAVGDNIRGNQQIAFIPDAIGPSSQNRHLDIRQRDPSGNWVDLEDQIRAATAREFERLGAARPPSRRDAQMARGDLSDLAALSAAAPRSADFQSSVSAPAAAASAPATVSAPTPPSRPDALAARAAAPSPGLTVETLPDGTVVPVGAVTSAPLGPVVSVAAPPDRFGAALARANAVAPDEMVNVPPSPVLPDYVDAPMGGPTFTTLPNGTVAPVGPVDAASLGPVVSVAAPPDPFGAALARAGVVAPDEIANALPGDVIRTGMEDPLAAARADQDLMRAAAALGLDAPREEITSQTPTPPARPADIRPAPTPYVDAPIGGPTFVTMPNGEVVPVGPVTSAPLGPLVSAPMPPDPFDRSPLAALVAPDEMMNAQSQLAMARALATPPARPDDLNLVSAPVPPDAAAAVAARALNPALASYVDAPEPGLTFATLPDGTVVSVDPVTSAPLGPIVSAPMPPDPLDRSPFAALTPPDEMMNARSELDQAMALASAIETAQEEGALSADVMSVATPPARPGDLNLVSVAGPPDPFSAALARAGAVEPDTALEAASRASAGLRSPMGAGFPTGALPSPDASFEPVTDADLEAARQSLNDYIENEIARQAEFTVPTPRQERANLTGIEYDIVRDALREVPTTLPPEARTVMLADRLTPASMWDERMTPLDFLPSLAEAAPFVDPDMQFASEFMGAIEPTFDEIIAEASPPVAEPPSDPAQLRELMQINPSNVIPGSPEKNIIDKLGPRVFDAALGIAFPPLGLANTVSGIFGGPTIGRFIGDRMIPSNDPRHFETIMNLPQFSTDTSYDSGDDDVFVSSRGGGDRAPAPPPPAPEPVRRGALSDLRRRYLGAGDDLRRYGMGPERVYYDEEPVEMAEGGPVQARRAGRATVGERAQATEDRVLGALGRYAEGSLSGLRRFSDAIDPMQFMDERDVAGFLPGAGMVEGYEQMGTARDKFREGDYLGAAGDYALGAFNSVSDVIPATALIPAMRVPDVDEPVQTGIRAYHGSPHDFDRFDLSKIGTGEGAQAYGHGLYFADSEGVARSYRDALSSGRRGVDAPRFRALGGPLKHVGPDDAHDIAEGGMPALQKRLDEIDQIIREGEGQNRRYFGDEQTDAMIAHFRREQDELRALAELGDLSPITGRMYEVNINADPNAFLDWDAPLSRQNDAVRALVDPRMRQLQDAGAQFNPDPEGEVIYKMMHPQGGLDKMDFSRDFAAQAADRLRESGIPGIKYLDAGSRAAGQGSRNYVVFDDSLITILRKYGVSGLAALPAGVLATMGLTRQQAEEMDANRVDAPPLEMAEGGYVDPFALDDPRYRY